MTSQIRTRARWLPDEPSDDELDEELVREVLLSQHDRLRKLLRALDAAAIDAIRGLSRPTPDLRAGLEEAAQALTDHMRGEERNLATLIPRSAGSDRALARLREDHARQRDEIQSMRRLSATHDDTITLALAIRAFIADVCIDMDLEDRTYLAVQRAADLEALEPEA